LGRRILVVDDDGLVLRSVAKVLSRAGYDVLTAVDVDSALRHAEAGPIDAALVDYSLSRETGLTVLSHLRDLQPRCVRILFTGRSDPSVMVEAVNRGEVSKVIRKHQEHDLLKELEDAFERARRDRRLAAEESSKEMDHERQALEEALREQNLALALQPIFDVGRGGPRPIAFEALLRPKHSKVNTPGALLSLGERLERIPDIGASVFRMARLVLSRLPSQHLLFVNLHPQQLGHPDRLAQDLAGFDGQCGRIVLEITEQSHLQKLDRWEESIRIIMQAGCAIAVDDLGAGYSSLSILADLQPAYIKLDMSLVRNIHREPRKQRLVHLMRQFGDATDARTIAEGVESEAEMRALMDCGIRYLQGYHFARPSENFVQLGLRQPTKAAS
jgi:EAL domain-containing protein (putative c-di-GMP-specific phosphodiesterase class I)/AmiR/NasT family two-component response regulator